MAGGRGRGLVSGVWMVFIVFVAVFGVVLNVPLVKASGTIYIRADGSIDPPTAPIQRNGDLYTLTGDIYDQIVVQRSNIIVDGNRRTVQGLGSGSGFSLSGVSNVTIRNTNIKGWLNGVSLYSSSNSTISGNNITNNYDSVGIYYSYGVYFDSSNYTTISENNITDNAYYGIGLSKSFYNTVSRNNIIGQWVGVFFPYSSNNGIYHNNFINNQHQVENWMGLANTWDDGYPSGGNFWSDYAGTDLFSGPCQNETGGDDIGDTPHVLHVDNQDRYPLIYVWPPSNRTYIRSDGSIDPPTSPINRDGDAYVLTGNIYTPIVMQRDNIVVDGAGYTVQGIGARYSPPGIDLSFRSNVSISDVRIQSFEKGVLLKNSSECTVKNSTIEKNWCGVLVETTGAVVIESNEISRNLETGIMLGGLRYSIMIFNLLIKGNTINQNKNGIRTGDADTYAGILITQNIIAANQENGIYISIPEYEARARAISNVTVDSNIVSFNGAVGITFDSGSVGDVNIHSNTVNQNGGNGITIGSYGLYGGWGGNLGGISVSFNTISSNLGNGINLFLGYMGSANNISVVSNTISTNYGYGMNFVDYPYDVKVYHNDFINNTNQASTGHASCTWDDGYPSGGNSWSDYSGTDVYSGPDQDQPGSDGIGDSPYFIDTNNRDNYPLLKPWVPPREPITWTVDDDGSANFTKIQEAINAAGQGDIVFVYSGTYYENVVMNKSYCTLVGESPSTTVIDGGGTGSVVTVTVGGVRISNFTIRHATYGITVDTMGRVVIGKNEISSNSESGVMIIGQSNVLIENNIIKQNKKGIATDASGTHSGITIVYNSILSNQGIGIYLYSYCVCYNPDYSYSYSYIYNINIASNAISSNQGDGIFLYAYSFSTSYTEYSGSYSYSYIYDLNMTGNTIFSNQGNGICLRSESYSSSSSSSSSHPYIYGINIIGNTISSNQGNGIYLDSESSPYSEYSYSESYIYDVHITGNTISSNQGSGGLGNQGNGIYLSSYSNTVYSEYSSADSYIYDIYITDNTVSSNQGGGIGNQGNGVCLDAYSGYSGSNSHSYIYNINVTGNTISSNQGNGGVGNQGNGVCLYSSSHVAFPAYSDSDSYIYNVNMISNTISLNKNNGIYNYARNHNSSIEFDLLLAQNRIHLNSQGILVEGGITANFTQNSIAYNVNEGVLFSATQNNEAHYNDIYGNGYGMNVSDGATVDAEENYWGDSSGPYHESLNPYGEGNSVNGNGTDLDFIPFLTNSVDSTPPTTLHDYNYLWYATDFTITLTATDDMNAVAETYYKINDGPTKTVSVDGNPFITAEGANNTLEYWSVDSVGNEENHHILTGIKLDKTYPTIETPSRTPDGDVLPDQSVKVSVNITDSTSGVRNVTLYFTINDGETWTELLMNQTASNFYEAMIPPQEAGITVRFRIVAYDHAGNNRTLDGAEPYCVYQVVPEFPPTLILPLFMILTLLAVISHRRKQQTLQNHI